MASAETCPLGDSHSPKEGSIAAFEALLPEIKSSLIQLRHKHDKHEPEYFITVKVFSDAELTHFTVSDLELVRVGKTDVSYHPNHDKHLAKPVEQYGLHIFGKIRLPRTNGGYIHVRVFVGGGGAGEKTFKLHGIYSGEIEGPTERRYRAILSKRDELEWFNE